MYIRILSEKCTCCKVHSVHNKIINIDERLSLDYFEGKMKVINPSSTFLAYP